MARNKAVQQNIDGSDIPNYPFKRIRDNDGSGNGTPVNEEVYGDMHEFFAKLIVDSNTVFNGLPENKTNGYQYYDALMQLANKNSLIKDIVLADATTIRIPIKTNILKEKEAIVFKASFNSTTAMVSCIGTENVVKPLVVTGVFKNGDSVRFIYNGTSFVAAGLYDSENVPNLVNRLTSLENVFATIAGKLAVFQSGGGMLFWNKPANQIPAGWAEVIDWRGRFPVGFDITQSEFNVLGGTGGSKKVTLTVGQMPKHSHNINRGTEKVGTGNSNGLSVNGGGVNITTNDSGNNEAHENLPPYRNVLFIEYTL